jgi:hypothetical protein
VNPCRLESLAQAVGCTDWGRLEKVCADLRSGADIGCTGEFRGPTCSGNAPSAYQYPHEVTEAIAEWVEKGFAKGPFPANERPKGVKINDIMCRPKPNGSARVILNLSGPAGKSVNEGINVEEFLATMASTAKWLGVLNRAGKKCMMVKLDWPDAYKHVHVRKEALDLQWFSWLGMDFVELCLVFRSVSSVGIYDRLAKVVPDIVARLSGFPISMVCQCLDNVCAAYPTGSGLIYKFERTYRQVAEEIGVRLAPTDDPEKAFEPCQKGTILGIEFDTVEWTWQIPREKLARLVSQIRGIIGVEEVMQEELASVNGRILH